MTLDPFISLVIVTYRTPASLLLACLSSVRDAAATAEVDVEVVIVENGHTDWSQKVSPGLRDQLIVTGENLGFGAAANRGVAASHGEYVLLLNPDAHVAADMLTVLRRSLEDRPARKLVACWLVKQGRPQVDAYLSWSFSLSRLARRARYRRYLERGANRQEIPVEKVTGGALVGRRDDLVTLGPFDENFFLYGEDDDLSRRARRAGFSLVALPQAVVWHDAGTSSDAPGSVVERARMDAALRLLRKHKGRIATVTGAFELAILTVLGAVLDRGSSRGRSARLARLRELRRWATSGFSPPPFRPR